MYWPRFSERAFIRKATSKKRKPSGVTSTYIPWTKYTGLKTFLSASDRDETYARQKRAAKAGLAPKVGTKHSIRVFCVTEGEETWCGDISPQFSYKIVYGYFTEHAEQIGRCRSYRKQQELERKLADIDIYHEDLHRWNIGRIRGQWVCIDFDPVSINGWR